MSKEFQSLDLLACYSPDWVGQLISYGTASVFAPQHLRIGPSHIAIICEHQSTPIWVESTTLCSHPCLILKRAVNGVQAHVPEMRIQDYVQAGGHVDLYRLSDIDQLSVDESKLLNTILIRHFIFREITYDLGGALLSGTRLFKRTRLFPGADLNELFCSELVAAVLMRLGRMNRSNPTRYNPACLLRELVREGTFQFQRKYRKQETTTV